MIAYVDGLAVTKRILDEPDAQLVVELWERAAEIVSSDVLYPQARAALATIHGEGGLDAAGHHGAVSELERLLDELRPIPTDDAIATAAGGLADRYALEALDAIHLAAALSVDAPRIVVATWQRRLSDAAADCGMPVVPRIATRAAA